MQLNRFSINSEKVWLIKSKNSIEKFTYVANNVHIIHILDTNASKYTEHYLWITNEISEIVG